MKLKAVPTNIDDYQGFDLVVTDPEATLQDYLDAVNQIIDEGSLSRTWAEVSRCEGCPGCCSERIPLTSIDIKRLMQNPTIQKELGTDAELNRFLGCYTQVAVEGQAVDIILGSKEDGSCLFLDSEKGRCRIHPWRPLVCQTFVCTPAARKARELREKVVNAGEDQLVRDWLNNAVAKGIEPVIHEADDPDLRLEDWGPTIFEGKQDYAQIKLKDICSKSLWEALNQSPNEKTND